MYKLDTDEESLDDDADLNCSFDLTSATLFVSLFMKFILIFLASVRFDTFLETF